MLLSKIIRYVMYGIVKSLHKVPDKSMGSNRVPFTALRGELLSGTPCLLHRRQFLCCSLFHSFFLSALAAAFAAAFASDLAVD